MSRRPDKKVAHVAASLLNPQSKSLLYRICKASPLTEVIMQALSLDNRDLF